MKTYTYSRNSFDLRYRLSAEISSIDKLLRKKIESLIQIHRSSDLELMDSVN